MGANGKMRDNGPEQDPRPLRDDLVGLDPDDPEARAFAEHLDRVERSYAGYTVEGYLNGVSDFADSANRLGGHHRLTAMIVVGLILLGVLVAAWDALVFIFAVFGF
jgi:hypothetical protein